MQVGGDEIRRRDASKERSWHSRESSFRHSPNASVYGRSTWDFAIARSRRIDLRGWPSAEVLDPLTEVERRAVSDRICNEVTQAATEILREEQETRERLNTIHIKSVSLMSVAAVGLGFSMVYLHMVLVPFILAIFFFFLLEPLLYFIIDPPGLLRRSVPGLQHVTSHFRMQRFNPPDKTDGGTSDNDIGNCGEHGRMVLMSLGMRIWGVVAVIICIFILLFLGASVVFFIIQAIGDFPWDKYKNSEKLRLVLRAFPELAQDPEALHFEGLLPWLMQGPLFNALDMTFSIISQAFLTLLFVSFLLSNVVTPGKPADPGGFVHKVRTSVQRYIRIKSLTSLVVAVVIGAFYWRMEVDLWFLFVVATFVLCYVPHVGNTAAVIMPLPIVFLDPHKSVADLLLVFLAPFVVHQLTANLVEPKLLASSLELHPIVVLLALAFWTTIWGAMGAILCVPLTAVVRLLLLELDHPYAMPIVSLLQGHLHAPAPDIVVHSVGKDSPTSTVGGASPAFGSLSRVMSKASTDAKVQLEDVSNSAIMPPTTIQPLVPRFLNSGASATAQRVPLSYETEHRIDQRSPRPSEPTGPPENNEFASAEVVKVVSDL